MGVVLRGRARAQCGGAGFDHVWVDRPLDQKARRAKPGCLVFKRANKQLSNNAPLLLRRCDAAQCLQELSFGIDGDQLDPQPVSQGGLHLAGLVLPEHPGVDKDRSQLIADRLLDQRRCNARVHPPAYRR